MCGVCGCSDAGVGDKRGHTHDHHHHHHCHGHEHPHDHAQADHSHAESHTHGPDGTLRFALPAGATRAQVIRVERNLLDANNALARDNRADFAKKGILALNLVSSPGSGKTELLVKTLQACSGRWPMAVIEGDQETANDAARIRATGAPAVQVNTGRICHLDAGMVRGAVGHLPDVSGGVLFIENVGNLVCPSGFDLGEAHKVVLASVTEGEDKPLKYPDMFAAASVMVITKMDLAPYLDFDVDALVANARRVRGDIGVIKTSARTGEGLGAWLAWIEAARAMRAAAE